MNLSTAVDEIDLKILKLLQHEARMPIARISKQIAMSQPSVKERIVKLEERGVITGYSTDLNLRELQRGTTSFILMKTELCSELVEFCTQSKQVTGLFRISGEYNYLIHVQTGSVDEVADFQDALARFGPSKSHISLKNILDHRILL